jgi:hypothetical protein
MLESIGECGQIADGGNGDGIYGRVAFQQGRKAEFTAEIEALTQRTVTAFLTNQTSPGVACEPFFLAAPPTVSV